MNGVFREYVTSSAFVLTLSKNQTEALAHAVERGSASLDGLTSNALLRRGLIDVDKSVSPWKWKPTTAGKLVYCLLIEAGVHEPNVYESPAIYDILREFVAVETDEEVANGNTH